MQIHLTLDCRGEFTIPLSYHYQQQSAIYAKLREVNNSDFWHDKGFGEVNTIKGFVFGPMLGEHRIADKKITFTDTVDFELRSPLFDFCDAFQRALELRPCLRLFDRELPVLGASLTNVHLQEGRVHAWTTAPVTAHLRGEDGRNVRISPDDPQFRTTLENNLARKYRLLYGDEPGDFSIVPEGEHKRMVTLYKSTWVAAYSGNYSLTGDYRCLELMYNAGIGVLNSEGFGMLQVKL